MKKFALALSFLTVVALVSAQEEQLPTAPPADAAALQKINALGGGAMPLAANTNLISVNFSLAGAKIDDAALESLKGVTEQLVWLNLANTSVTDAGLKSLAGFKNLRRLHLEKTGVGDEGLASVKSLAELTYLNLYSTKVTDKGLANLSGLKKLKNVYLWQTAVTDGGAAELAKAIPGLYINRGIDPPAKVVEIAAPPAPEKKEEKKEEKKDDKKADAKPINAKCPLSGKDVNPEATFTYQGQVIGLCCNDCKAKFAKEPEKYIEKVKEFKKDEKKSDGGNVQNINFEDPINKKCPIKGTEVAAGRTVEYKKQLIGFCCADCVAKFESDPEKWIKRVKEFKKANAN
ncbi:MAG: hypothetical protein JO332_14990 [Planctomycetaceae bacterium]|nr:hypothetical protein [Planctomycetaceae bacterium]